MKFTAFISLSLAMSLTACVGDKSRHLRILGRDGSNASVTQEKTKFSKAEGCLNLEAVMEFYKKAEDKVGRITIRDVASGSKDANALPAVVKARPLEIALDQAPNLNQYFPLRIVKQTNCESIEILDAEGKSRTLNIVKNRDLKRQPVTRDPSEQPEPPVTNQKRNPPKPGVRKKLPTSLGRDTQSEYQFDLMLLSGDNGEKWAYKLDAKTKNLIVSSYQTIPSVKGCPGLKDLRIKEIYDVTLLTNQAEPVRVSDDVLAAIKEMGVKVPGKPAVTGKKPQVAKTPATQQPPRKTTRSSSSAAPAKAFRSITSDQYSFLAKQLLSDKAVPPSCVPKSDAEKFSEPDTR